MSEKKDFTGLLITFIGMIISLITGFGFIITLVGVCMVSGVNEKFRISRNYIIGSLVTSVAGLFVVMGAFRGMTSIIIQSGSAGAAVAGFFTAYIVAVVLMFILQYIFNRNAFLYLMFGCADVAKELNDDDLIDNCMSTAAKYKSALLAYTIVGLLATALIWVPGLNVLLIVAAIGVGIWYLVMQIFLIVRVWQTYSRCK